MVDREAKRAEGKGVGYDRWAAKHKITDLDKMKIEEQKKAVRSGYDMDISATRS